MNYEKYYKDGNVAVLYSPGFGAGWYSWNQGRSNAELLLFDKDIVQAVLDGKTGLAAKIAEEKMQGRCCVLGAEDLRVRWLPRGTAFEISEYDGSESVRIIHNEEFLVA